MTSVVHRAISDGQQTVAVVFSEGFKNRYVREANQLSIVRVENDDIGELFKDASKLYYSNKVRSIYSEKIDPRSQGPNSQYNRTLVDLLEILPRHLQQEHLVSKDNFTEHDLPAWRASVEQRNLNLRTPAAPAKFPNINDDSVLASAVTEPSITARRPMRL